MLTHSTQIIVYTYDIFKGECDLDDNKPVPSLKEYNKTQEQNDAEFPIESKRL